MSAERKPGMKSEAELEQALCQLLNEIPDPNRGAAEAAEAYQERLVKPPGSLGVLEQIAVKLAGITGKLHNAVNHTRIVVLCADNGVVAEGVSIAPQRVTVAQAVNMTRGITGMSSLAREFGCEVQVVDVGIKEPYECPDILNRRIAGESGNILKEAAMTRGEALQAILTGMQLAGQAAEDGVDLLGVGEMGIGNTTTSAAVLAALTGASVLQVTGRGGGLSDQGYLHKQAVIRKALALHHPDGRDALQVLAALGGFDLAAMCGVFLGAALHRLPVVMDGFVSAVAALLAYRMHAGVRYVLFPSHQSDEAGFRIAAQALSLEPWLLLHMRLGEGSGCPLAFQLIRAACAVMNGMESFEGARIDDAYLSEIRKKRKG